MCAENESCVAEQQAMSEGQGNGTPSELASTKNWQAYFSTSQWLVYGLLIILGLFMRWYDLGSGPFHHDESMHAMFGLYYQDHPNTNYYKYNPMMHGPVLYHTVRFVYNVLGISAWSSRFPVALLGSLFLFLPFLFRRYFTRWGVLALSAAVALSPSLIYWSRFIIHDYFVLAGLFILLYGVTLARPQNRSFLVLLGITLQWCTKANLFVTLAIVTGYLLVEWTVRVCIHDDDDFLLKRMFTNIWKYKIQFLLSLLVCILIYCYFYTAEFRFTKGILDGLYREVFPYWIHHHNIERIKGPFSFNFFFLCWYESIFMLAFVLHLAFFYRRVDKRVKLIGSALTLVALLTTAYYSTPEMSQKLPDLQPWKFLKLKGPFDLFWSYLLLFHSVVITFYYLLRKDYLLGFTGYFFLASYWSYSYLGEKVPWLATYPLLAGLVYLTLYFENHYLTHPLPAFRSFPLNRTLKWIGCTFAALGLIFLLEGSHAGSNIIDAFRDRAEYGQHILFGVGLLLYVVAFLDKKGNFFGTHNLLITVFLVACIYNIRAAYITNFLHDADASEYISQVHTTHEFDAVMKNIRAEVENPLNAKPPIVLVTKDGVWPATWYFRGMPGYHFSDPKNKPERFDYIIQNFKEPPPNVPEGYEVKKIKLRGWWVPDYRKMTLTSFFFYALNHTPWGPTGYSYVHLLMKPKGAVSSKATEK
ncbi:TIGR03663 family protein [Oligoflexia bacterium]|nr:TIGR03663 family protein [Oligoflexia bacterium]